MRLALLLCTLGTALGVLAPGAGVAAAQDDEITSSVRILEISGLVDPVMDDFIRSELDQAVRDESIALVLQMDSLDVVLSDDDFRDLIATLDAAPIDIVVWVGPPGSALMGNAAEFVGVADLVGVAKGSRIGETGDLVLGGEPFGDATDRLRNVAISAEEAVELGISIGPLEDTSFIGPLLTYVDGFETEPNLESGGISPTTQTRFVQLPLSSQLFHTMASPEVAYLMFVLGLSLLLFELFTAGVGVAGLVGTLALVLGCYGLAVLPTSPLGVALLILAFLAMAVDVQTNVPRAYTIVGLVFFVLGTWQLYDGVTMSWVTGVAGIVGAVLYATTGMPSMVRTRFSTPTIGRRWMIGEMGTAASDLSPDGTIELRDALWQARTNRATPITAGDSVRVIAIDELVLEVEPEEGAAKDYRERS